MYYPPAPATNESNKFIFSRDAIKYGKFNLFLNMLNKTYTSISILDTIHIETVLEILPELFWEY